MMQRSGFNLRKHPRVKIEVGMDVEFVSSGEGFRHTGASINLSEGGMAFEYPRGLVEGDEVNIAMDLPGGGGRINMRADVVHCLWPEEAGKLAEIRVRFKNPEKESRKLIHRWIVSQLPEDNTLRVAEIISDRRGELRFPAEIDVSYQLMKNLDDEKARSDKTQIALETINQSKYFKNVGTVLSDNLSVGGMRLRSEEEFPAIGVLSMVFQLPDLPIELHALGRIAWIKEEEGYHWAGVEFLTLDKDDAIRIEKHVFDKRRDNA